MDSPGTLGSVPSPARTAAMAASRRRHSVHTSGTPRLGGSHRPGGDASPTPLGGLASVGTFEGGSSLAGRRRVSPGHTGVTFGAEEDGEGALHLPDPFGGHHTGAAVSPARSAWAGGVGVQTVKLGGEGGQAGGGTGSGGFPAARAVAPLRTAELKNSEVAERSPSPGLDLLLMATSPASAATRTPGRRASVDGTVSVTRKHVKGVSGSGKVGKGVSSKSARLRPRQGPRIKPLSTTSGKKKTTSSRSAKSAKGSSRRKVKAVGGSSQRPSSHSGAGKAGGDSPSAAAKPRASDMGKALLHDTLSHSGARKVPQLQPPLVAVVAGSQGSPTDEGAGTERARVTDVLLSAPGGHHDGVAAEPTRTGRFDRLQALVDRDSTSTASDTKGTEDDARKQPVGAHGPLHVSTAEPAAASASKFGRLRSFVVSPQHGKVSFADVAEDADGEHRIKMTEKNMAQAAAIHGRLYGVDSDEIAQITLLALESSKSGLTIRDLALFVAEYYGQRHPPRGPSISAMVLALGPCLSASVELKGSVHTSTVLTLRPNRVGRHTLASAIRARYDVAKEAGATARLKVLRTLSRLYRSRADPTGNCSWPCEDEGVLRDLMFYQARCVDFAGLRSTFCDSKFIAACARLGSKLLRALIHEMRAAAAVLRATPSAIAQAALTDSTLGLPGAVHVHSEKQLLQDFAGFAGKYFAQILAHPDLTMALALDQPVRSGVFRQASADCRALVDAMRNCMSARDDPTARDRVAELLHHAPRWWLETLPTSVASGPGAGHDHHSDGVALVADFEEIHSSITSCVVSHSGAHLAAGLQDGTVRVVEASTGEIVASMVDGVGGDPIVNLAFSRDDKVLAAATDQDADAIVLWMAHHDDDGDHLEFTVTAKLSGHMRAVTALQFLEQRGPRTLVSASVDFSIFVWRESKAGGSVSFERTWSKDFLSSPVAQFCQAPNAGWLMSAHENGSVLTWSVPRGSESGLVAKGDFVAVDSGGISAVTATRDGSTLVTGSSMGAVQFWEATVSEVAVHWRELTTHGVGHHGPVTGLALSADGRLLMSSGTQRHVCLWDTQRHRLLSVLAGHRGSVNAAVAFPSRSTVRFATVGDDEAIKLWDASELHERVTKSDGDESPAAASKAAAQRVRFAHLTARSAGGTKQQRRAHESQAPQGAHAGAVTASCMSPDGTVAVTGSDDTELKVWDCNTGDELLVLLGHSVTITAVCFSQSGDALYSADAQGIVLKWDASTYQHVATVEATASTKTEPIGVSCMAAGTMPWHGTEAQVLFTGDSIGDVKVWQLSKDEMSLWPVQPDTSHTCAVAALAQVEAEELMGRETVHNIDSSGDIVESAADSGAIPAGSLMPGTAHLASVGENGRIIAWRKDTMKEVVDDLTLEARSEDRYASVALSSAAGRVALAVEPHSDATVEHALAAGRAFSACVAASHDPESMQPVELRRQSQETVGIRSWGRLGDPGDVPSNSPPGPRRSCTAAALSWDGALLALGNSDATFSIASAQRPQLGPIAKGVLTAEVTSVAAGPGLLPTTWPSALSPVDGAYIGDGRGAIALIVAGDASGHVRIVRLMDAVRIAEGMVPRPTLLDVEKQKQTSDTAASAAVHVDSPTVASAFELTGYTDDELPEARALHLLATAAGSRKQFHIDMPVLAVHRPLLSTRRSDVDVADRLFRQLGIVWDVPGFKQVLLESLDEPEEEETEESRRLQELAAKKARRAAREDGAKRVSLQGTLSADVGDHAPTFSGFRKGRDTLKFVDGKLVPVAKEDLESPHAAHGGLWDAKQPSLLDAAKTTLDSGELRRTSVKSTLARGVDAASMEHLGPAKRVKRRREAPSSLILVLGALSGSGADHTLVAGPIESLTTVARQVGGVVLAGGFGCSEDLASCVPAQEGSRCIAVGSTTAVGPLEADGRTHVSRLAPSASDAVVIPGSATECTTSLVALALAAQRHVPVVAVVFGGTDGTLGALYDVVLGGAPVVVMDGSGGTADVIAEAQLSGLPSDPALISDNLRRVVRLGKIAVCGIDSPGACSKTVLMLLEQRRHQLELAAPSMSRKQKNDP